MTALNKQALRSKARSASAGEWIKESGDGWEAICSAEDQANSNFIIAHFEGPDARANREFSQAANPGTVLALLDENLQLQRDKDSLEAVAIAMRDDMRDAREKLEELDNALCELLPGTQYMDPPDGGSVTPLEQVRRMVADYRERIAILESRKVCVPRISNDEFWLSFNNRIVFREETYRSAVTKAIEDAGIGVKGE